MRFRPDESIRWDVIEEHLEEACFLWTQWESGLCSARQTLLELATGDEFRLKAHLQALALGGEQVAERILIPALKGEDVERIRAASHVLLLRTEHAEAVIQALLEAPEPLRWPFARALSLSQSPGLSRRLLPLLTTPEPDLLATLVEILTFRRGLPADTLSALCRHEVPRVQAAALRAACTPSTAPEDAQIVRHALASPHAAVRAAGLVLGLYRHSREAFATCAHWSNAAGEAGRVARLALAIGGDPGHLQQLLGLLEVPGLRREILWALGFSGRIAAAEACIPWLRDPALAGIAAETLCGITGLVLEGRFRVDREDTPDDASLSQEEDMSPNPDSDMEWPEPDAIERWWSEARRQFGKETRYIAGKPFSGDALLDVMDGSTMRRRPVLALELAIRTQGLHAVEVSDFSHFQTHQLASARARGGGPFWTGPFATRMNH
ncbi:TIGR02270 family protein [Corallococcus sp. bb12-1]|uniref:TIGR02270 family protein n=1 Tax=Corallococcus sp. bb12-1 TaxID=2996784 RepID=UPI00226D89C2|nr:TIGR02270 family protein [Corallococcus sp. bb12-1]MCY1042348.1 TIGR02270 family protein [Corallococcus sp. bb12-1]